ncbi:hypothetical protein [Roseomonas genomospecies 6]|uniref:Uncharacterized protein n=1 Tax=Roseomonas genomospecies 6 TaxID=214106 RepID=A0A9W7TYK2_9PROT|nr:hypothetical protein [Roseomonas genomospecies 6]KAA0679535.1 hypothetical protein DS843_16500 [Roseomonas genomospecies 6]
MEDGLAYVWPEGATAWTEIPWSDWVAFTRREVDRLPGVVGKTHIILCVVDAGVVLNMLCHHDLFGSDGRFIKRLTVLSDEEKVRQEALMVKGIKQGDLHGEEKRVYDELNEQEWEGSLPSRDQLRAVVGALSLPVSPDHGAQHLLRKAGLDRVNWTTEASC